MMPEEPLRDVMRRTMFNLRLIEEQATKGGPYEVTQLVNSFLGALAHPWEKFKVELAAISLSESVARGWPQIHKEFSTDKDPENLGDLLRLLRHGIAHGNIEFLPDECNKIEEIKIWNVNPHNNQRTWGTVLSDKLMHELLDRFVELAEELHEHCNCSGNARHDTH